MTGRIYMDNGATSFPKAPGVSEAMCRYLEQVGSSVGRGYYSESISAQQVILETRELLCELFNFDHADHVVFTKNSTEALNILIKGLFKSGDHVIISPLEHNAVMRPLVDLEKTGVLYTKALCDQDGNLILKSVEDAITEQTKAILMTHGSNVCGTVLDLAAVGQIARRHKLLFLIDASQTAGVADVDFKALGAHAIAFTGHKGLLGPQGTGGMLIDPVLAPKVDPLIFGGTGSASDSEEQPEFMPDKFEAGTPNIVGLYGLHTALKYILDRSVKALHDIELDHVKTFLKGIEGCSHIRVVGKLGQEWRTAVISLDFIRRDNAQVCWELDSTYGIATRVGMHCAPSAHHALNTYPQGTVRFSFSPFTTREEVLAAIHAVIQLA